VTFETVTRWSGARDPQWAVTIARRAIPRIETAALRTRDAVTDARQGLASFYWQGQLTASGERFDKSGLTAAHRTLPMGTKVRVTHLASGRAVTVRINDRGPFVQGRVIDLSEAAADAIGMRSAGLAAVRLDVVHE